ncbi:MAG: polyprenyl synthetase family protein [Spirochaetes bacterium]|nr:polyprenyl synthetase family protein [Spirochaetota bacterium]
MSNFNDLSTGFLGTIDGAIELFLDNLESDAPFPEIADCYAKIKEFCLRPGKRLRPLLLIASYQGYSGKKASQPIIECAALIEIMHSFLLIHDDIVDNADQRRGGDSLHRVFGSDKREGEAFALVSADMMIFDVLSRIMVLDIDCNTRERFLGCFSECYRATCVGQILDLGSGGKELSDVDSCYRVAHFKTAFYTLIYPVLFGYILSGGNDKNEHQLIKDFFLEPGIAFQIRDDYIGVFSSEGESGKSEACDLHEQKVTTVIAEAFLKMNPDQQQIFSTLFRIEKKNSEVVFNLRKLIIQSGAPDSIRIRLQNIFEKFENDVRKLALEPETKELFVNIVKKICLLPVAVSEE